MSHPNIDSRIASRRQTVLSLFSLLATKRAGSGVIPSATHGDSLGPHPHPALAYRGPQQKLEITSHSVPRWRYPDRRAPRMQSYDLDLRARGEL